VDVRGDNQLADHVEPGSGATLDGAMSLINCREELDFHTSILEAIGVGVLAHTLDGRIIYVNEAACKIYGFCRSEFENLGPWGWVPEHGRHLIPGRIAEIRKSGGTAFAGFGPPHDDGHTMFTEVHSRICTTSRYGEIVVSAVYDSTDRVIAEERVRHMALHDELTGLPNRGLLQERMRQALANADRHGDIIGVVYADLDDFKPINDTFGHTIGDEVLRIVADRLRSCMRESDTVARVGGDEFVALFPRLDSAADLATVAASISGCIDVPIQIRGHQITVTTSVGLAVYREGEATDELITRADHAMYRAKQDGLSGWEEYLFELTEAAVGPA
jgi:diguanylate cyclase (GGDEF)-like protein/PAS domain S-box-containing protein